MIPAQDHDEYDMMQHFADAWAFVDRARERHGRVLIHCNLGINRCGVITAACVMLHEKRSLLDVARMIKSRRSVVLCNDGFRKQLIRFARARRLLDPYVQERSSEKNNTRRAKKVVRTNSNGVAYPDPYSTNDDDDPGIRERSRERSQYDEEDKENIRSLTLSVQKSRASPLKIEYSRNKDYKKGIRTSHADADLNKMSKPSGKSLHKAAKNGVLSNELMDRIYRYIQPGKCASDSKKRTIEYRKPLLSTGSSESPEVESASERQPPPSAQPHCATEDVPRVARRYNRSNTSDGLPIRPRPHSYCDGDTYEDYTGAQGADVLSVSQCYSEQPSPAVPRRYEIPKYNALSAITSQISALTSAYKINKNSKDSYKTTVTTSLPTTTSTSYTPKSSSNHTSIRLSQFDTMLKGLKQHTNATLSYVPKPSAYTATTSSTSYDPRRTAGCDSSSSGSYVRPYRRVNLPSKGPVSLTAQKLATSSLIDTTSRRPYTYAMHQMRQPPTRVY